MGTTSSDAACVYEQPPRMNQQQPPQPHQETLAREPGYKFPVLEPRHTMCNSFSVSRIRSVGAGSGRTIGFLVLDFRRRRFGGFPSRTSSVALAGSFQRLGRFLGFGCLLGSLDFGSFDFGLVLGLGWCRSLRQERNHSFLGHLSIIDNSFSFLASGSKIKVGNLVIPNSSNDAFSLSVFLICAT